MLSKMHVILSSHNRTIGAYFSLIFDVMLPTFLRLNIHSRDPPSHAPAIPKLAKDIAADFKIHGKLNNNDIFELLSLWWFLYIFIYLDYFYNLQTINCFFQFIVYVMQIICFIEEKYVNLGENIANWCIIHKQLG